MPTSKIIEECLRLRIIGMDKTESDGDNKYGHLNRISTKNQVLQYVQNASQDSETYAVHFSFSLFKCNCSIYFAILNRGVFFHISGPFF